MSDRADMRENMDNVAAAGLDIESPSRADAPAADVDVETSRLLSASLEAADRFRKRAALRRGYAREWGLLAAGAAALVAGVTVLREPIVRTVPSAAGLYAMAGIEINLRGMEFRNVGFERQYENGVPVLAISGRIVNITDRARTVPKVRFSLRDSSNQELYRWSMKVRKKPLDPRQSASFAARLAVPPANAHDVEIRFARAVEPGMIYRP